METEKILKELPDRIQDYFLEKKKRTEGAQLVLDIFKLREAGIFYDRDISVRLFSYIIAAKGKKYKSVIRFIDIMMVKYKLSWYFSNADDVLTMLLANISKEEGRTWKYEKISFAKFAERAIVSMLEGVQEKKKPEIIDGAPDDEEEEYICNITELIGDNKAVPLEIMVEQNERIYAYKTYLKNSDPVAFEVLQLKEQGYSTEEISNLLNLTLTEVKNSKKRYRTATQHFFPDTIKDRLDNELKPFPKANL